MTYRTNSRPWPGRNGVFLSYHLTDTANSPRGPNGKLVLNENRGNIVQSDVTSYGGTDSSTSCPGARQSPDYNGPWPINQVHARLRSKLHAGGASLGVTLASMNQSMAMIVNRFDQINGLMDRRLRLTRRLVRRRPLPGRLASDVLEVEFGWRPFIADIANAMATIADHGVQLPQRRIKVSASHRITVNESSSFGGEPRWSVTKSGSAKLTATASYEVTNPNLWLMNRLGLLNPVQVAWDRVPWSWVVNMFVNANQLIGSINDTFGLSLGDSSTTYSSRILRETTESWNEFPWAGWNYYSNVNTRGKVRVIGIDAIRPSLEFRLPNFNLELGVIASALAVQKSGQL